MDMSLLVKTAGICLYSDFHNGLLKLIRVQKKILLKNMLHKNLPGILDPAVYPSRNLFPQSTSFLGRICPFSENKSLCFKIMNYLVAIIIDYDS